MRLMPSAVTQGFILVLIAGVMNGSFAVPMKWTRAWAWENTWLAWSSIALMIFPIALAVTTVPGALAVYQTSSLRVLSVVCASGIAWGISQVLFGLGIKLAGVALGFAIVVGLAAAAGSVIPLVFFPVEPGSLAMRGVLPGVAIVIAGVALCSYAGSRKGKGGQSSARTSWAGILLCAAAGIGGSMINVGMVFGAPLAAGAGAHGATPLHEVNAIWLPLMFAGFVATSVYCVRLLSAHGTWGRFYQPGLRWYWLLALVMAVCWFGSVVVYGIAAANLGRSGAVFGWPMFLSASIVTANLWGMATGEWKSAPGAARWLMFGGVSVLVIAIFLIGAASRA